MNFGMTEEKQELFSKFNETGKKKKKKQSWQADDLSK